ncbi:MULTISPECIES: Lrp/AsnC family transcriptional regulator [Pseudomonadaceae]|jgi:DNA-binding Lrp family transcriptional regulator|uniref:Lrp/AsnC family transcriptional regulator n=1 Tax=Pseudomonadaceae TaxID=135621 RepID=UPI00051D4EF8|nr:AsnC family transcriptional regulator [Stutzerimonas degradans]MCF6753653.1 Lrp/AsnC family transcriptional regulator [Stutzerimonas stutzeri]MDT3708759.1 AsnC family transcriptional regulator [Pseudomonadaceae bacterium]KGK84302.1 protein nirG [Stutzerimonas degradans]MCQ4235644.1 Lrp/AsnC family transcriptional regulator [Stutzerimonas degradans]NHC09469.1 Lrp/AsnC family transcriptional regulator [Stutzerimonas degradans]
MDDFDRQLINRLQHGLPLVRQPWQALAEELGSSSEVLRARVQALLDDGTLTRFGPMFDIERLGGAFTLAALSVPEERFDEVAAILDAMPEVAHNYRREHAWNMWFVLGCATPEGIAETIARIEAQTGLPVLNLPKEETYHVGLHFPV